MKFLSILGAILVLTMMCLHIPLLGMGIAHGQSTCSIVGWGVQVIVEQSALDSLVAVAGCSGHSLGLKSDGTIVAWGNNGRDQCDVPAPNEGFVAVDGGEYHNLGLKSDGTIVTWGQNYDGQCDVPEPNEGFVAIAAGMYYSLGLKSDGTIVGWGDNEYGQCDVPAPNEGFVAVAGNAYHSLGLKSDGSIVAWGRNDYGQCNVPAPNEGFVAVTGGSWHSLGLKSDGTIVAWGRNDYGQRDVPEPNEGFVAVAGGYNHSLGLKSDGTIVAWGYNHYGQCNVPEPNEGFVEVAGGGYHSLGLKSDGTIVVWGNNNEGQCDVPEPNEGFVGIAGGYEHSLGLRSSSDNIVPGVPQGLTGAPYYYPENELYGLLITWDQNPEINISHYAIYKDTIESFMPRPGTLLTTCIDPVLLDVTWQWMSHTYYKVCAVNSFGRESGYATLSYSDIYTGDDVSTVPISTRLSQNYPNPFNPVTTINYTVPIECEVEVKIFNVQGELLNTLVSENKQPGSYSVTWDGRNDRGSKMPSGVYFYVLKTGDIILSRKMVMLK